MKSIAAHYLLLIYIIAMCKPVLPFINDFLAHTFWKTEHIITVHHENGKDHLHYELKKVSDQNNEDANSPMPKSSESVSVHILLQNNNYDFSYSATSEHKHFTRPCSLFSSFLDLNAPPPKT